MEPNQEHTVRGEGSLDPSATQSGWTTRSLCCPGFQEEVAELFRRHLAPSVYAAPSAFLKFFLC